MTIRDVATVALTRVNGDSHIKTNRSGGLHFPAECWCERTPLFTGLTPHLFRTATDSQTCRLSFLTTKTGGQEIVDMGSPLSDKQRPQAGHKALHTCTSWYAYAAIFGSPIEFHLMYGTFCAPVACFVTTGMCFNSTPQDGTLLSHLTPFHFQTSNGGGGCH